MNRHLAEIATEASAAPLPSPGQIAPKIAVLVLDQGGWHLSARLVVPDNVTLIVLPPIAWKAHLRLCARYRRLAAAGKRQTLVTTAIAREMAAFLWAIGHAVEPRSA